MRHRVLITIALAVLGGVLAAPAALAQPEWNSGYSWWPGGFGSPPVTVQAANWRCSVTVYGPTYRTKPGNWFMYYGGGTSCVSGIGQKSLTVYVQTMGKLNGKPHWYTVFGTGLTSGPTTAVHLRRIGTREAYLGHQYRVVAVATLVVPNAYAGHPNHTSTITLTARSPGLAP
jgi:hypothetical protein